MATKLLLITQDELIAKAYRAHLGREGFDVGHCPTGRSGLTKARGWIPEVILLDPVLPGLDGLDVVKWLRDVPSLVRVPVVLLVEHTLSPETLQECLRWSGGSVMYTDCCSLQDIVAHLRTILKLDDGNEVIQLRAAKALLDRGSRVSQVG